MTINRNEEIGKSPHRMPAGICNDLVNHCTLSIRRLKVRDFFSNFLAAAGNPSFSALNTNSDRSPIAGTVSSRLPRVAFPKSFTGRDQGVANYISKSDEMKGVIIVAPSDYVHVDKFEEMGVIINPDSPVEDYVPGIWNIYYNGELINNMDGLDKPSYDGVMQLFAHLKDYK